VNSTNILRERDRLELKSRQLVAKQSARWL
jgi:hypothetical protein